MLNTTFIYSLSDPSSKEVRYIGKSDDPEFRLRKHLRPCNLRARTVKNSWLKSLLDQGVTPTLEILEEVAKDRWPEAERRWILHYRNKGCDLTNGNDGGIGGTNPTDAVRAKLSSSHLGKTPGMKGRKHTPESLKRMSESHRGYVTSEETKQKLSAKGKGRVASPEQRQRLSQSLKGNSNAKGAVRSAEWRQNVSNRMKNMPPEFWSAIGKKTGDALRGRSHTEEHRRKVSEALKGHPVSAETAAKIAASKRGRPRDEATRRKLSETNKARGIRPPSRSGTTMTEEQRKKISLGLRSMFERRKNAQHSSSIASRGLPVE